MLARLARLAVRHPRATLATWATAIVALAIVGLGTNHRVPLANVQLSGTEAAREIALRDATLGPATTVPILVEGRAADIDAAGPRLVRRLRRDEANHVLSPFDGRPAAGALRPRRGAALVVVVRSLRSGEQPADALAPIRRVTRAGGHRVRTTITGPIAVAERLNEVSLTSAARAQLLAVPLLLLVLLALFRSPIAALIPAAAGAATVAASTGIVRLGVDLGLHLDVLAPTIAGLVGLALGVDYSLLIVTRFRSELAVAGSTPAATARAALRTTLTSGRTVGHAAIVLAVAMLCAIVLAPGTSLLSAAFAILATTAVACTSALVAAPAALVLIGKRIDRWTLGPAPAFGSSRIAGVVLRRPSVALVCLVPLLALAAVGLSVSSGAPTVRQLAKDEPTRAAIERLRTGFGVGWEAPLEVTAVADRGSAATGRTFARLVALQRRIARLPDVQMVVGPAELARRAGGPDGAGHARRAADRNAASVFVGAGRGGDAMRMLVIPKVRWGSPELARLRDTIAAQVHTLQSNGAIHAAVGGLAAETVEYDRIVAARLPLLFAALMLTSLGILAALLRALPVAAVTVALNVVTVAATLGVLSLAFVGSRPPLGGPGEIDLLAITIMLVVIFALSIDYQVFLLGRMREHLAGGSRRSRSAVNAAIREGLVTTGPVVAGAALIMCSVFGAFAFAQSIFLRQLGTGLVVAIALDATIVRMVLLPATLALLGPVAWTPLPLPRLRLEAPIAQSTDA